MLAGVAPIPWRAVEAEKGLIGKILETATVREAAQVAVKNAEPLGKNAYKVELVKGILEETLAGMR